MRRENIMWPLRCWKQASPNRRFANWRVMPACGVGASRGWSVRSCRIEYGRPVTREALDVIERGEEALRGLGFRQFRVRHHGEIVRIEIARDELERALTPAMAAKFTTIFKALGFHFVTLDLEGFRSGSMNSLLPVTQLRRTG